MNWLGSMRAKQHEVCRAEGPEYYDKSLKYYTQKPGIEKHFRQLAERAAGYTVGTVLDLGCGLGWPAEYIGAREYVGIDFSGFAIEYARQHAPPNAIFIKMDVTEMSAEVSRRFDTVMALELLEHVENPWGLAQLMLKLAKKRIVVSVPQNMPGEGHVFGVWDQEDLEGLFGKLSLCEKFKYWWIAVHEKPA